MKFTDQINHIVSLPHIPKRIVSVVPSQTELLFELGLEEEVVGITKFCVHPPAWFRSKTRVGGTKNLNLQKIEALQPDLIIANKEENTEAEIKYLQQKFPVWTSDIATLHDSLNMIKSLGDLTNTAIKAQQLIHNIQQEFDTYRHQFKQTATALYLIWQAPYMSVGKDTIIHHLMEYAGLKNVMSNALRYPEISEEEMMQLQPDFILLSSEPYPFKEKHVTAFQQLFPNSKVLLVDGELFSWYGARLQYAPKYFFELFVE